MRLKCVPALRCWSIVRSCEEGAEAFERSSRESRVAQPTRDRGEDEEEEVLCNSLDYACRQTSSSVMNEIE
jgi:hypothetical protein